MQLITAAEAKCITPEECGAMLYDAACPPLDVPGWNKRGKEFARQEAERRATATRRVLDLLPAEGLKLIHLERSAMQRRAIVP